MKKLIMFLAVLAIVFSAGNVLAGDDVYVDVENTSKNNVSATGGNAQQDQNQDQNQWQGQNQNACATGGAGGQGGSATGGTANSNATGGNANANGGKGGSAVSSANPIANGGNVSGVAGGQSDADASAVASPIISPVITTSSGGGRSDSNSNAEVNDSGNSNSEINHSGNSDVNVDINGVEGGKSTADANSSAEIGDTTAKNETTVKGVDGDQSIDNQNIYTSPENKRSHINAPTGPSGNFLGAGFVASKDWQMYICQPLFRSFTSEELEVMSKGAGGWFSSGIQKSLRIKKVESYDENFIVRLDFMPAGPNDKVLGEYEYTADEPMPFGQALAHVLFEAKKDTNTHRVIVWVKERGEVQNSGLSIGSGVAGSRLWGPGSDGTAGAIGLGGLIGTTTARTQEVYGIRVWALNEGSNDPPKGVEVCGLTISAPTSAQPVPILEEPVCDPEPIRQKIRDLAEKISNCNDWGLNNMGLRLEKANAFVDLALCTGENGYFQEAIKDYAIAERNYLNGRDIADNRVEADQLLAQVFFNWAGCIYEIYGAESAADFAKSKNLSEFPNGFSK